MQSRSLGCKTSERGYFNIWHSTGLFPTSPTCLHISVPCFQFPHLRDNLQIPGSHNKELEREHGLAQAPLLPSGLPVTDCSLVSRAAGPSRLLASLIPARLTLKHTWVDPSPTEVHDKHGLTGTWFSCWIQDPITPFPVGDALLRQLLPQWLLGSFIHCRVLPLGTSTGLTVPSPPPAA